MQKLDTIGRFKAHQNIILKGFDPVSAEGFTQIPNFIISHKELSSSAKIVYAKLLSYAWDNDQVFPGQEKLSESLGVTTRSIIRQLNELKEYNLLEIQRRGQGKTNIYVLKHTVTKTRQR